MSENETTNPTLIGEIEQGPSKFDQFLDRNQKNLIVVGILLVILVAGFIVFRGMQENKGLSSSAAFINADSVEGYKTVAEEQAGTPAGGSALITLANKLWEDGSQDESISALKSFVDDYSDHAAYPAALINLAGKLARTGESTQASSLLDEAVELEDATFSPVAQYLMSEIKSAAGDTNGAVTHLDNLSDLPDEALGGLKSLVEQNLKFTQSPVPSLETAPVKTPEPPAQSIEPTSEKNSE